MPTLRSLQLSPSLHGMNNWRRRFYFCRYVSVEIKNMDLHSVCVCECVLAHFEGCANCAEGLCVKMRGVDCVSKKIL